MNAITEFDFKILNGIQDIFGCELLNKLMPAITLLCDHGIVPIVIAVALLCVKKTRKIGLSMGFSFIYGGLFGNLLLKNLVARHRPYDISYGIGRFTEDTLLISGLSDFSFPSGHTFIAFELATVLVLMLMGRKKSIAFFAYVLAVAIAFSRLYLYVHFPTDVLTGMLLGALFGFLGVWTAEFADRRLRRHI